MPMLRSMYAIVSTVMLLCAAALVGTACPPEPADSGDPDPPVVLGNGAVCSATADCGGETPLCTLSGFCVECDPVAGEVAACDADEVCGNNGLCGDCASDADCGAGEPFCTSVLAREGEARCVECRGPADCGAAAPSCDPRGECVAACSEAAPCAEGVCDPAFAACVDCVTADDCTDAERPLCNGAGRCVECNVADDCGAAQPFCVDGRCEECVANTDCGPGGACSPDLECQSLCTADADCGDGDNRHCDVASGACRECVEDAHCTQDGDNPVCVAFQCEECRVDADCPADAPTCDLNDNECRN